ncbi:MAG: helix-turn-helix transcriptional regulator [Clostridia bacterium]|nr:helix-turn-helix transcriptional regulator [Clostridia bacterium]
MYKSVNLSNCIDLSVPHKIEIASYNYYPNGEPHPDRVLTTHDLFILLDGSWEVWQDDNMFILNKGDALFLFAGRHHYGIKNCAPNTKTIFIHFYPSDKDVLSKTAPSSGNYAVFPTIIHCSDSRLVYDYMETITSVFWSRDKFREQRLEAYSNLLFCELASAKNNILKDDLQLINDILNEIHKNPQKFFTLDELSGKYYISKRKLVYMFKEHTGVPPHTYQLNTKLDLCHNLIKYENGIKIKAVAERYGFYDEYHFSKVFKKKFGYSPSSLKR